MQHYCHLIMTKYILIGSKQLKLIKCILTNPVGSKATLHFPLASLQHKGEAVEM
jgi:hypothetical protein